MVEDLDEIVQAVLVHGVYQGQVSHDEEEGGASVRHGSVLLPGQVDLSFSVLGLLHPFLHNLCSQPGTRSARHTALAALGHTDSVSSCAHHGACSALLLLLAKQI